MTAMGKRLQRGGFTFKSQGHETESTPQLRSYNHEVKELHVITIAKLKWRHFTVLTDDDTLPYEIMADRLTQLQEAVNQVSDTYKSH